MREKNVTFFEQNSVILVSYALALTLSLSIFTIYDCAGTIPIWIIFPATAVFCIILYLVCNLADKHHFTGGVVIAFVTFLLARLFTTVSQIGLSRYEVGFLEWLLTKGSDVDGAFYYMLGLFLFFPTFFCITVYYFSQTLYRMFFLTLLSLIPCVLYVKVMSEINNVYLILIALLNVGIFIMHQRKREEKVKKVGGFATVASSVTFILLLFLVTSFIPKVTETPYYDDFEDLFMGGDTSSDISSSFSELGDYSGDASGFFSISNRKLYTLAGDEISYLKRQNFDYYDFKKNRWYADKELAQTTSTPDEWFTVHQYLSLSGLRNAILAAEEYAPGFISSHGIKESTIRTKFNTDSLHTIRVQAENFGAIYYLSTSNCVNVMVSRDEPYYVTPSGTFFSESTPHDKDFSYSIQFYNDPLTQSTWIKNGGSDFTSKEAVAFLSDLRSVLSDHDDLLANVATAFLRQQVDADYYRSLCEENNEQIPEEIQKLALQITEGLENDYDKASALAEYFHTSGFVYDLGYRAPNKSPVYFLTQSKRGTCSDYATAYTLMARSVGLTVRYAEGYVPEHGEMYWQYTIKSKNSHAYPEVFIPNVGWMVFEPTVSLEDNTETGFPSFLNFFLKLRMDYGLVGVVVAFLVFLFVLLFVIRILAPLLGEGIFRIRLFLLKPDKAAVTAYGRIVKKGLRHGICDATKKTPYEMAEFLSSIGCDIHEMCYLVEKVLYGSGFCTPDKSVITSCYKLASKALLRYRKP